MKETLIVGASCELLTSSEFGLGGRRITSFLPKEFDSTEEAKKFYKNLETYLREQLNGE